MDISADFDNEYGEMGRPLDPAHRFVYTEFMNNKERQCLGVPAMPMQTVLIIDTETRYFNASKLFTSFSTNGYTLSYYIKSKSFLLACDEISKMLQNSNKSFSASDDEEATTANNEDSDSADSIDYLFDNPRPQTQIVPQQPKQPFYTIEKTKTNELWHGLYMHPYLLSHLLISINPLYCFKLSEFISDFHIRQSTNKTLTLQKLINNNKFNAINDMCEYNEISNIIQDLELPASATVEEVIGKSSEEMKSLILDSDKFDLVQFLKSRQYINDYKKFIGSSGSITMKRMNVGLSSSSDQTLIIVAHYDKRGRYAYGSKSFKLTFDVINTEDLSEYMALFNKPNKHDNLSEAEYEQMIFTDKITIKTGIIMKIISLHDLPPDVMNKFADDYSCEVNMYIEMIDRTEYLIVNNIDKFKTSLSDFLLPYMKL